MHLEVISPEAVLLNAEVNSVKVPGLQGEFQILENHAPVVSLLGEGVIAIDGDPDFDESVEDRFSKDADGKWTIPVNGGTIEMNHNKVVILIE